MAGAGFAHCRTLNKGKVKDLMIRRVAIIGAGGFGEVMLAAMTGPEERAQGVELVASHRRPERRAELQEKYGITVYSDNREACEGADVIYPLVRPDQMGVLMEEIGPGIGEGQIVAAGRCIAAPVILPPVPVFQMYPGWVFPTSYMSLRLGYLALCPEPGSDPERIRDLESYWGRFCEHVITIPRGGDGHVRVAPRGGSNVYMAGAQGLRRVRVGQRVYQCGSAGDNAKHPGVDGEMPKDTGRQPYSIRGDDGGVLCSEEPDGIGDWRCSGVTMLSRSTPKLWKRG